MWGWYCDNWEPDIWKKLTNLSQYEEWCEDVVMWIVYPFGRSFYSEKVEDICWESVNGIFQHKQLFILNVHIFLAQHTWMLYGYIPFFHQFLFFYFGNKVGWQPLWWIDNFCKTAYLIFLAQWSNMFAPMKCTDSLLWYENKRLWIKLELPS